MANNQFLYILLLFLSLLFSQNTAAQFAPGKKPKGGIAVEYRKVKDDTLQVRKSKLEPKKRKSRSTAAGSSAKKSVKKNGTVKSSAEKSVRDKEHKIDSVEYPLVTYRLGDRIIMRGDSGADVRNVACILVRKIYMDEDSIIYTEDGNVLYEGELVKAVMRFQRLNGFYEDGIIGHELIKALRKRK